MRCRRLAYPGLAHCCFDCLLHNGLVNMITALLAGLGIYPPLRLRKYELPSPFRRSVRILSVQRVGQLHSSVAIIPIAPVGILFTRSTCSFNCTLTFSGSIVRRSLSPLPSRMMISPEAKSNLSRATEGTPSTASRPHTSMFLSTSARPSND